jgi:hypothetical protein
MADRRERDRERKDWVRVKYSPRDTLPMTYFLQLGSTSQCFQNLSK